MRMVLLLIGAIRRFFSRQEICLEKKLWISMIDASRSRPDRDGYSPRRMQSLELTALRRD